METFIPRQRPARVLVTSRLPTGALDALDSAADFEVEQYDGSGWQPAVGAADAVVCLLTDRIDADVLASADRLRVVANVAVGYDNIDVPAAIAAAVVVCNTPGVLTEATADLAFALILAAARLLPSAEAEVRGGTWRGWDMLAHLGREVSGATLGLVGYGAIARAVARRAAGFAMPVLHHARTDSGEPGYRRELDDLLAEADIVSLHVPLTPATRRLIDARRLELMGPGAVLVNTARGPVVDEAALAAALHAGRLFAAGLDVYEHEPAIHPDLLTAPRTVLLPHIGSATGATRLAMARLAVVQVRAVLAGERPAHPVNDVQPRPPTG